jgi:hypothetical protein
MAWDYNRATEEQSGGSGEDRVSGRMSPDPLAGIGKPVDISLSSRLAERTKYFQQSLMAHLQ